MVASGVRGGGRRVGGGFVGAKLGVSLRFCNMVGWFFGWIC